MRTRGIAGIIAGQGAKRMTNNGSQAKKNLTQRRKAAKVKTETGIAAKERRERKEKE